MENLFLKYGIPQTVIDERIKYTFHQMFRDPAERFYFEMGDDAGYMMDTGNYDARTEGMSYGMMMAVQLDEKDIFDRLWRFSKRYMYLDKGYNQGFFAWSVAPTGESYSDGPAPDGEEYYAMALFFASHRWGDGEAPLDYSVQARDILRHCIHQKELAGGQPMWNPDNHLIKFITNCEFSDPSYHLPHFYELFAKWADEADRPFWAEAAKQSRLYLEKSCHPKTGMAAEYAHYDGTPERTRDHGCFYSDAYRVAMNIGLDSAWFGKRASYTAIADKLQAFLADKKEYHVYEIDGTQLEQKALHPLAILCTTAAASLATDTQLSRKYVLNFWNTPMRQGERRYFDNCLYLFCLMMLAGKYTIIE